MPVADFAIGVHISDSTVRARSIATVVGSTPFRTGWASDVAHFGVFSLRVVPIHAAAGLGSGGVMNNDGLVGASGGAQWSKTRTSSGPVRGFAYDARGYERRFHARQTLEQHLNVARRFAHDGDSKLLGAWDPRHRFIINRQRIVRA